MSSTKRHTRLFLASLFGLGLLLSGGRAYQAAKAGIERGSFQSLRNNSCPGAGASANLAFPAGSLAPFTVTVACVRGTFTKRANNNVKIDRITANACNQPTVGGPTNGQCPHAAPTMTHYVERELSASIGAP